MCILLRVECSMSNSLRPKFQSTQMLVDILRQDISDRSLPISTQTSFKMLFGILSRVLPTAKNTLSLKHSCFLYYSLLHTFGLILDPSLVSYKYNEKNIFIYHNHLSYLAYQYGLFLVSLPYLDLILGCGLLKCNKPIYKMNIRWCFTTNTQTTPSQSLLLTVFRL